MGSGLAGMTHGRPASRVLGVVVACLAWMGPMANAAEAPTPGATVPDPAVAATAPAGGNVPPLPGQVTGEEQVLDEVIVEGTRLWKLRQNIVEAEERFYALYNELNPDKDFDITCRMEAPLGTRLKKRNCKLAFFEDAEAEYAQSLLAGGYAPDPNLVMLERSEEYRKNALALLNGHPQLLKLARERERAEKRYNDERKKRFKGRWFAFD